MNTETAIANYALLRTLPPHTRLCVNRTNGKMTLDERWLISGRRYLTGDSRKDLEEPIRSTFRLVEQAKFPTAEILETIAHAKKHFELMYPEFCAIFDSLAVEIAANTTNSTETADTAETTKTTKIIETAEMMNVEKVTAPIRHRKPEKVEKVENPDVRIYFDDNLTDEAYVLPTSNNVAIGVSAWDDNRKMQSHCFLFEWFPCLRVVGRWLRESFSLDE